MTIQEELDLAEVYLLNKLIGDVNEPTIGTTFKLLKTVTGFDLVAYMNNQIEAIESRFKPLMDESGFIIGKRVKELLKDKGMASETITVPDFKPIDLVKVIDHFLNLENIGQIIQRL